MLRKIFTLILIVMGLQTYAYALNNNEEDKNMTRTEICINNFRELFKGEALTNAGDLK